MPSSKQRQADILKKISQFLFAFILILLGSFHVAQAAAYNASDLLEQINGDGTVNWTTNTSNDHLINNNGMNQPSDVALDGVHHRLFIYDNGNNRVLIFNLNSDNTLTDHTADYVLGQPDFISTTAATTQSGIGGGIAPCCFTYKGALAYDSVYDRLFVADDNNRRVLVFNVALGHIANGENADYEIGQPAGASAFTTSIAANTQSGFTYVYGIAYDSTNSRLFVADPRGRRVTVFNVAPGTIANGENADYELGQLPGPTAFTSSEAVTTQYSVLDSNRLIYDSDNSRLFVSDGNNRRIMIFNVATSTIANGELADYELGQPAGPTAFTSNTQATTQSGLRDSVEGVAYDSINLRLFVADINSERVMVWNVATSTIANGELADYELGQPAGVNAFTTRSFATSQSGLNNPSGLAYDSANNHLFVSDTGNNRIMIFDVSTGTIANGKNADDILGQSNQDGTVNWTTSSVNNSNSTIPNSVGLLHPRGVEIDPINHRLFVGDCSNNRVLIFNLNSDNTLTDHIADYVLGQPDFITKTNTVTQSGFYCAGYNFSFTYDSSNTRLFVGDSRNNRVMVFNVATSTIANGELADYELGQPAGVTAFTTNSSATSQSGLNSPDGLAYDSSNTRLFVADNANNRVMVFNVAPGTMVNGKSADYELGQPAGVTAFTTNSSVTSQSGLKGLTSLAYDSSNTRLFVDDRNNNRVMVFNVATSTIANGELADYELGQPAGVTAFTTKTGATSQNGLNSPFLGLAYDPVNSRLFVGDGFTNNRIMVFNVATSTIANGENASAVLGQTDFVSATVATTQSGMNDPAGLAYDSVNNRLFVTDDANNRLLIFNLVKLPTTISSAKNGATYNLVIPTTGNQGTLSFTLTSGSLPPGLSLNSDTGIISSYPTEIGTFSFGITVTDTVSSVAVFSDSQTISMEVDDTTAPATSSHSGGKLSFAPYPTVPDEGFTATANATGVQNKTILHFDFNSDITTIVISNNTNFISATYVNATSSIEWTATTTQTLYIKYCNQYNKCSNSVSVQTNTPTPVVFSAYKFHQNLTYRMIGPDILELQKYLNTHGFVLAQNGPGSAGNETNYFGLLTYEALIKFQEANSVDILIPSGLTKGTGYFGPNTRAFVNR